jgi:SAM-dependent methyltransferase
MIGAGCPSGLDVRRLRRQVASTYTRLAVQPAGDFHFHRGSAYAADVLGYDLAELESLPRDATDSFAGVGNPLAIAPLGEGECVLDIGCGAGMDLLLAARRVGPGGSVIGVDPTPAMRRRARSAARAAGLADRIRIVKGEAEALPVDDASVDVVISNGVLNLTPDKARAFAEIRRVLRPSGRLQLADVVVQRDLLPSTRGNADLWAACVGGALVEADLQDLARRAGLVDGRVTARHDAYRGTAAGERVRRDLQLGAVSFYARVPA